MVVQQRHGRARQRARDRRGAEGQTEVTGGVGRGAHQPAAGRVGALPVGRGRAQYLHPLHPALYDHPAGGQDRSPDEHVSGVARAL